MRFAMLLLLSSLCLLACKDDPVAAGGACKGTQDCVKGLVCSEQKCADPEEVAEGEASDAPRGKGPMKVFHESKKAGDVAQQGVDKRMEEIMNQGK